MLLTLSHSSPINATYTNGDGQAIYKVHSSFKLKGRSTTITRILPSDIPSFKFSSGGNNVVHTQDRFAHLARINWNVFTPSLIRYGEMEVNVKNFFRKGRWGPFGRDRIFTAPDGREYRWVLGLWTSKLYLNNEAKTPAARFHHKRPGIFQKSRKASLEIFPPGEDIVDAILVTFVYIEKLRKDREGTTH